MVCLLENVKSQLVVLPRLGILAFFVERLGGINSFGKIRKPQAEQQQYEQIWTDQASHQAVLMKISLAGGVTGQTHPATIQKTTTQPNQPGRVTPPIKVNQPGVPAAVARKKYREFGL